MTTTSEWKARTDGPEYDAVRGRIVDAAEIIVRDGGVNALRLDAVAEAAGLHRSSFYRYFGSKEDLLTAVVAQASRRVQRKVMRELGPEATPEQYLAEGLALALGELAADPVHRALADPSASEAMAKVGSKALASGLRPVLEPVFDLAAEQGRLREGVTPEMASSWLQIVTRGLLADPVTSLGADETTAMLRQMLLPVLFSDERPA